MVKRSLISILSILFVLGVLLAGCSTPKALPGGPGAEWNLVVIGDSSMWVHGEAYARQIEKDLGVKVVVDDFALPSLSASSVREVLETGKSPNARLEQLPDAIREAEVVVMFVNPIDSINPEKPLNLDGCFGSQPPGECSPESFANYTEDLKVIWAKILELRKGKATILRATDIYNPLVRYWNKAGVFAECDVCWSNMSAANRQAAEAYNIPFASRYDLLNGAAHSEDPVEKGYIRADGEHPTALMGEETARLLAKLGYEPVQPSK